MYSSNASHSCEVQDDFLEKLKGWGNLSSHPPLIIWLQECDANLSYSHLTPSPLSRLSLNFPEGSPWERLDSKRCTCFYRNLTLFCFSEEMEYVENQRNNQSLSANIWLFHSSGSYGGHCHTEVLGIAKSNGAEYTFSSLFVLCLVGLSLQTLQLWKEILWETNKNFHGWPHFQLSPLNLTHENA